MVSQYDEVEGGEEGEDMKMTRRQIQLSSQIHQTSPRSKLSPKIRKVIEKQKNYKITNEYYKEGKNK